MSAALQGISGLGSAWRTGARRAGAALLGACWLGSASAPAADGFIIGDSIGLDLSRTVKLPSVARVSFSLRRHDIKDHLQQSPKGAVVLLSLGLNDAADPVAHLVPSIERVIAAATASGVRMVWIGPPCVLKSWDGQAEKLDQHLRQRLAATAIQYVSLRDGEICQSGMRTGDGEHFTPKGYAYVWRKIQRDSSYAGEVNLPVPLPAVAAQRKTVQPEAAKPAVAAAALNAPDQAAKALPPDPAAVAPKAAQPVQEVQPAARQAPTKSAGAPPPRAQPVPRKGPPPVQASVPLAIEPSSR